MTRSRAQIYASRKYAQVLSATASAAVARRGLGVVRPASTSYLLLLYADAERTLPHLRALSRRVSVTASHMGGPVVVTVAPLKGAARACAKTLEKYRGDFSRLTDLARMTFECETLTGALAVLNALAADGAFTLLLLKNRLMLAFDADPTGGYRDLLLNLRCGATGHIAEVQITLRPLLAVKTFGGHAAYALARVHHLNDPEIFRHEGALSTRVLTALRAGLIRELKCNGVVELARHQSGLFDACRSPTCLLDCLVLAGCDWPADQPMTALLEAVQAVGPQLKELRASSMGAADGRLPPSFFERSPNLQLLLLRDVGLNGPLPESLGALTHARCIRLWGNRLSGSIPTTIGRCAALQDLQLYDNVLTGPIPEALGECTALHRLDLHNNRLSGSIPPGLGRCVALQDLQLYNNELTGSIPDALVACTALVRMCVANNPGLSGVVPAALRHAVEAKGARN